MKTKLLCILAVILGLSSCTIHKRQHQHGFYCSWNLPASLSSKTDLAEKAVAPTHEETKADSLFNTIEKKTLPEIQDTVIPAKEEPKSANADYVRPEEKKIQMEATATELTHSATSNLLSFVGTVAGGLIIGSMLSGVGMVLLGILLLGAFITLLITNVRLLRKIKAFEKRYAEFSKEEKFENLHQISGFNNLVVALSALGILLIVVVTVALVFAIATFI